MLSETIIEITDGEMFITLDGETIDDNDDNMSETPEMS